jgi:hypothetical protein
VSERSELLSTLQNVGFSVTSDNVGGLFLWFVSFGYAKEMNAQRQRNKNQSSLRPLILCCLFFY